MIRLLSKGDRVSAGNYRVHSRFARAANFICGDSMVTAVNAEIGSGPLNLVVTAFDFSTIETLTIGPEGIYVDNWEIHCKNHTRFSSRIECHGSFYLKEIKLNLKTFAKTLISIASPKSLVSLFNIEGLGQRRSRFDAKMKIRLMLAINSIANGDYWDAVNLAKGVGHGLTPCGDDLIAGMLSGLWLSRRLFRFYNLEVRRMIFQMALGDNIISNTFLRCALNGWFTEKQKNLILEILNPFATDILDHTRELISVGATSGADWATGFVTTMLMEFEKHEE